MASNANFRVEYDVPSVIPAAPLTVTCAFALNIKIPTNIIEINIFLIKNFD